MIRLYQKCHLKFNLLFILFLLLFLFPHPLLSNGNIALGSDISVDDLFEMSLDDLINIEISTAGKKDEKVGDVPASVIVITRADIEKYGYTSLEEIFENVPGLYQIDDWQITGANFGIRGFWSDLANHNIVIMVNNVRMNEDFAQTHSLTFMPVFVEAIDRIEVVRGPMSVIYGSGAFFGAINIITNESDLDLFTIEYGSYNSKKVSARLADSKDNGFQYSLNTSYSSTDGLNTDLSRMSDDLHIKSDGLKNEERKFFHFSGKFNSFYTDVSFAENISTRPFLIAPNNHTDHYHMITSSTIHLGYKKQFTNILTLNYKVLYKNMHMKYDYGFGLFPNAWEFQINRSRSFETELDVFIVPSEKIDITLGLNYNRVSDVETLYDLPALGLDNFQRGLDDDMIETFAGFTQVGYTWSPGLRMVAGIRAEWMPQYHMFAVEHGGSSNAFYGTGSYDYDEVTVIPRLAIIYTPVEKHVFKFLYGQAINRPGFHATMDIVTEPQMGSLEPEMIRTLEINYLAMLFSGFTMSMSLFNNHLDNLIARNNGFDSGGKYYSRWGNIAELETNGLELQIQTKPTKQCLLDLAVTYQKTEDNVNKEIDVSYSPSILSCIKFVYNIHENVILSTTGIYVDEMYPFFDSSPLEAGDPNSSPVGYIGNGKAVDSYINLNANLRIENILKKGIYINLRCTNLLDKDIYYPTVVNQPWAVKGTLAPGRSIFVTLGMKLP